MLSATSTPAVVVARVAEIFSSVKGQRPDETAFGEVASWVEAQLDRDEAALDEASDALAQAQPPQALEWFRSVVRSVSSSIVVTSPDEVDEYCVLGGFPVFWRPDPVTSSDFTFIDQLDCAEDLAKGYAKVKGLTPDQVVVGSNPVTLVDLLHRTPLETRELVCAMAAGVLQMDPLALDAADEAHPRDMATVWPVLFRAKAPSQQDMTDRLLRVTMTPELARFSATSAARIEQEVQSRFGVTAHVRVYPALLWRDLPNGTRVFGVIQLLESLKERHPEAKGLEMAFSAGWLTFVARNAQGQELAREQTHFPDEAEERLRSLVRGLASRLGLTLL